MTMHIPPKSQDSHVQTTQVQKETKPVAAPQTVAVKSAVSEFKAGTTNASARLGAPSGGGANPYVDLVGLHKPAAGEPAPDPEKVGRLQDRLIELGSLTTEEVGNYRGTFGDKTAAAIKRFQASQNLPQTGVVDYATAEALADPRPPIGEGMGPVAAAHVSQLGRPTGPAETQPDGSVRQQYDQGYIEKLPDGSLHVHSDSMGLDQTYHPGDALAAAQAAGGYVNQIDGDPAGGNANCGFASGLMAMNALGLTPPTPDEDIPGTTDSYKQAMMLRKLGGGGTDDTAWGRPGQIAAGLNAAGANAAVVENTWGADKAAAVDVMRRAFMDPSQNEAFVVAGNPTLGWPDSTTYNDGHFVTVVGYDPAKDVFIVMDPYSENPGPFEVSAEDMAKYMSDGNTETGELIQVTPPPPTTTVPRSGQYVAV